MKKFSMFFGVTVVVIFFSGYLFVTNYGEKGSGTSFSELRELESFDKITLEEFGTVNVSFGDTQSVTVTTDDNLVELVETTVEDGELMIRPIKAINPKVGLVIDITLPELSAVELAGAARVNIYDFDGESLDIEIAGACGVDASGSVKDLKIEMAGACRADMESLQAENAEVEIAGTGKAVVYASKKIDATASGFATITCHGNPKDVEKEANGISKIKILD